jgi:NADPH-dependent 2,4-dienoyl-CoA reductase/sulfur reductase-like enzyme
MMKQYDYLIVGGGIAGTTAAETLRERNPQATIALISEEPYPLYSRVLLPSYVKKKIPREKVFLRTIASYTEKNIDLFLGLRVVYLDPENKHIYLSNRQVLEYGKLLIASGGSARKWELEEKPYIARLQTLDDADRLLRSLDLIRKPVVIGASFISLEFLEIFVLNKSLPTLLARDGHFLSKVLDPLGGDLLRANFERHGIKVQFNDSALELKEKEKEDGFFKIITKAYREIEGDVLALGIGIERNISFLRDGGILLGEKGVRVNEYLETSREGIYAAGDVAEFFDIILGKYQILGNWTNAFLQGKHAALNMSGERAPFRNVSSYSITNLGFQITVLGDCSPEYETVMRIDPYRHQYERFFIKDGVLLGAALINRFQDKPHLTQLIANRTKIEEYKDQLTDFKFDIHIIPPANMF